MVKSLANVSVIVNDALMAYDKFVDNGVVKELKLAYWTHDVLEMIGMERLTSGARTEVIGAFEFIGIRVEFTKHLLRVTMDESLMPINWRTLIKKS